MYIDEMTIEAAKFIAKWQYPDPYSDYSFTDCDEEVEDLLAGLHFPVYRESDDMPCGFLSIGWAAQLYDTEDEIDEIYEDESYTDIGFGLRPDLCDKGLGRELIEAAIVHINELFDDSKVRLTVASDNIRAITLYKKLGFVTIKKFPVFFKNKTQEMEIMIKD